MSAIYKAGQGYWVRLMSAYGLGAIVALGLVWLWKEMQGVTLFGFEPTYVRVVIMLLTALVFAWFGWMIIGIRHKSVEFLIASEGEMRKVNWSSRREVELSTRAVIGLTILIAVYCWAFDVGFASIFRWMTVLRTG
jgi:preprotein translocase SecE subunit